MSSLKEFQCEICGTVSENPVHWFVIECGDQQLAVIKWDLTAASSPTARHFCGEAHAQRCTSAAGLNPCARRPDLLPRLPRPFRPRDSGFLRSHFHSF